MHLLIDTISTPATYTLFDSERNIVSQEFVELKGRESEHFLVSVLEFLAQNSLEFQNLEGVVVVNGPGPFTAMRIITLVLNTLSFVHHTPLYSIDYFALGAISGWDYPILLRANRGEYLIQRKKNTTPELIPIPDIPPGSYFGIGDTNDFTNGTISIQSAIRYDSVCKNVQMKHPVERVEPLYIKKPHIT